MNWMPTSNLASAGGTRSIDDTVIGVRGTPYSCPDVSAVDHHIVRLYKRTEHAAPWLPEFVQLLWADIDLLLDHRIWLDLTRSLSEKEC